MVWDGDIIPLVGQQWDHFDKTDALCFKAKRESLASTLLESDVPQNISYIYGMQLFRKSAVRTIIKELNAHLGGTFPYNVFEKFSCLGPLV